MEKTKTPLLLIISCLLTAAADSEAVWFENICQGKENLVKLTVYIQDIQGGPSPTVYTVAISPISASSPGGFGVINVVDHLVTAGPDINSEAVGRAQGLAILADLHTVAASENINFVFTAGEFNGSTITTIGRNQVANSERELTVAGGTGAFRFARGYAITRTYLEDTVADYLVLQYTFYVTRYAGASRGTV
ncbi:dirigent protein 2-like [Salvia hispanica]|uniref:dirigent protein 2-like n=1 Tax=Salvia hispanica TaxID=49212 RepID=UPI002009534E|nr:dirigent protein 2-like [Salvia hispanica]